MISRLHHINALRRLLKQFPIVAIIGARQVGKTTLARIFLRQQRTAVTLFDLEDPRNAARLADPMLALKDLRGIVVIDEVQRKPEVFEVLRVLADRSPRQAQFLVLGSASPAIIHTSAETLAGRIAYHELSGFSVEETGLAHLNKLWQRGGFPGSYLAASQRASVDWRSHFIRTFLERDIPQLGINLNASLLYRFWSMVAHYHGQIWNSSELARSFGVADTTIRKYLDLLTDAMVVRQLPPWSENLKKRQIKSPKVYVLDSGLLHSLLNIYSYEELQRHPKVGASWEGFFVDQIIRLLDLRRGEYFFWGTHTGAELDLVVMRGRKRIGFEIKRTTAPAVTPSMRSALTDLHLHKIYVVHAGDESFVLHKQIHAIAASRLLKDIPWA